MIGISKRFKLPNYKAIANHPENRALMAQRGSADNLQVGDVLSIENPIEVLEKQINTLNKLKLEMEKFYSDMIKEQKDEYSKAVSVGENVDTASTIINLGISLGKLVHQGYKTLSMSAKELAEANRKLAKDTLKAKGKFATEEFSKMAVGSPVTGDEGMVLAVGKIAVQSWFDMQSPSYWAQRFVGVDLKTVNQQTELHLKSIRNQTIQNLDKKIQEKTDELLALRSQYGF